MSWQMCDDLRVRWSQALTLSVLWIFWEKKANNMTLQWMEPGDQQIWHWICMINLSLFSTRIDLKLLHHLNIEKLQKMKIHFYVASKHISLERDQLILLFSNGTDRSHKSHNAFVPYPTIHHSEQKCAHFCSERYIVGYGTQAFWDM